MSTVPRLSWGGEMQDMKVHLEKLRIQIAECEMIRDLATNPAKQELFGKLAEHFKVLAAEADRAIAVEDRKTKQS